MPRNTLPAGARPSTSIRINGLLLDITNRQLVTKRNTHHLTPMECRLLAVLMQNAGDVLSRKYLMQEVWRTSFIEDTRTLEVHVCWLRKKIEQDPRRPQYLRTIRGRGYQFAIAH
ncbi:MAG: winged helix-turn-helix domain-containing protein [Anaerolineae bacterium]